MLGHELLVSDDKLDLKSRKKIKHFNIKEEKTKLKGNIVSKI